MWFVTFIIKKEERGGGREKEQEGKLAREQFEGASGTLVKLSICVAFEYVHAVKTHQAVLLCSVSSSM